MNVGIPVGLPMRKWLLIAAIAFVAAECLIRLVEAKQLRYPVSTLSDLVVLKKGYWTLRPDAAITQIERSGDVTYVINHEGYRGPLPDNAKVGKRIVFLGDSVTFGLGVDEKDTYARRLEALLHPAVASVEVANLALFAYGPYEYLSTWRRLGRLLAPDLVVVQLYMNDFGAKPWDQPAPIDVTAVLSNITSRLVNLSALVRRIHQAAHMAFFYWIRPLRRAYYPQSLNDSEPKQTLALLRAARNLDEVDSIPEIHTLLKEIKASGARVLLIYSPHETQLYKKDYDDIDGIVERAFAGEADRYIDPLGTLRSAPNLAVIFRDGLHYDLQGHALIAQTLAKPIEQLLTGSERK